ncbi:MAG: type I 3-dehydroquinate dehydratase [Propionibacteriaceae bacterium]|nr:type I 3-dehydroquinate dehydratase [Propionibacteriaceae bacterium]
MSSVQLRNVTLGWGRPKVIVPLVGGDLDALLAEAATLAGAQFDILEWRADFLADCSPGAVWEVAARLREAIGDRALLFTFRTRAEGGQRRISPEQYRDLNCEIIGSGLVDGVDVEHRFDRAAGDAVIAAAASARVPVIGSLHDFTATPPAAELVAELTAIQRRGCSVVKAAVMPQNPGDVLELLAATWTMTSQHPETPVLTMAMGGLGMATRLVPQLTGSCATFAQGGAASAPGQIPLDELQPVLRLIDEHLPAPAVALIGLPGSGKSTVGPRLASRLGVPHRDVDQILEQRQGRSIPEIFATCGESHFRELERDLTLELLTLPGVLSLGGGAPMTPAIRAALARHPVVWLRVDPRVAARRVGSGGGRPLLAGEDALTRLVRLLTERGPTYAELATVGIDTSGSDVNAVVEAVAARLTR